MNKLKKGDIVYYARIIPTVGLYDVYDLKIRTVEDAWFVGVEKRDKQAYLFSNNAIGKNIFKNRKDALTIVKDAEKNKVKISEEKIL